MPPKTNSFKNKLILQKPKKWQLVLLAILILLLAACSWTLANARTVRDWYILATYTPPKAISDLAKTDTMTSYAKKLFYVNEPQLENKQQFAAQCPNGAEQTYVIGCYHSGDNGIYLLNIHNTQLNGIIPVTAAYEMLHAGYARLSSGDKSKLDKQMWSFYKKNITSAEIKQQMAAYAKTEPGEQYDELYSVLATEVMNLPVTLENHYRLYFTNRKYIVQMYINYQSAFTNRQKAIAADDAQLAVLKSQISSNEAELTNIKASIDSEQSILTASKNSGNINAYNNGVPNYNDLVDQYNSIVNQTKSEIDEYNVLVTKRNSLAFAEQQLVQALNASPQQTITKN